MKSPGFLQRLRLRHFLFTVLVVVGIVPLVVTSVLLIWQNRGVIEEQERDQLVRAAGVISREVDDHLEDLRRDAEQLGASLATLLPELDGGLRSPVVGEVLGSFRNSRSDLVGIWVLDPVGQGPSTLREPPANVRETLLETFAATLADRSSHFRYVSLGNEPAVVVAVPVALGRAAAPVADGAVTVGDSDPASTDAEPAEPPPVPTLSAESDVLVVQILARLGLLETVFRREAEGAVEVALLEGANLLWSEGLTANEAAALTARLGQAVGTAAVDLITEYRRSGEPMLAQVSRVPESDWMVVVQKPVSTAFSVVDRMIFQSVMLSLALVGLAFVLSLAAARRLSQPIQRLTEASHEIADGNFGRRVETEGLLSELADLGSDFNRMGEHVERYIGDLREAARENRDLFIGSLRAFAAAIDAKDPYTRGHSERVASVARIIARQLGMDDAFQERIWISGILHDVGKIGVEDRVLNKGGRLTDEEFDMMKNHTVIGADILSSIEALREMIPAVRWHHEAWNGKGYPDGLKGEQIPLIARIVSVADTFDAITTNRPYQKAYTLDFAVETIIKLTGSRFDAKVTTAFLRSYELGEIRPAHEAPRSIVEPAGPTEEAPAAEVRSRVRSMT